MMLLEIIFRLDFCHDLKRSARAVFKQRKSSSSTYVDSTRIV
jgi:hypothetical protein